MYISATGYNGWFTVLSIGTGTITLDAPFAGNVTGSIKAGGKWLYIQLNKPGFKVEFEAGAKINCRVGKVFQYSYDWRNSGLLFYQINDWIQHEGGEYYVTDVNTTISQYNGLDANGLHFMDITHINEDGVLGGRGSHFNGVIIKDFSTTALVYANNTILDGLNYSYVKHKFTSCRFFFGGTETDACFGGISGGVEFYECYFDASRRRRSSHALYWGLDRPDVKVVNCEFRWIGGKADQLAITSATNNGSGKVRLNGSFTTYGQGDYITVGSKVYVELDNAHTYNGWHKIIASDSVGGTYIDIDIDFTVDGAGTVYAIGSGGLAISRRGSSGTIGERFQLHYNKFYNSGASWIGYATGNQYGYDSIVGNEWYNCDGVRLYNHINTKFSNNSLIGTPSAFSVLDETIISNNIFKNGNVQITGVWEDSMFINNLLENSRLLEDQGESAVIKNNHFRFTNPSLFEDTSSAGHPVNLPNKSIVTNNTFYVGEDIPAIQVYLINFMYFHKNAVFNYNKVVIKSSIGLILKSTHYDFSNFEMVGNRFVFTVNPDLRAFSINWSGTTGTDTGRVENNQLIVPEAYINGYNYGTPPNTLEFVWKNNSIESIYKGFNVGNVQSNKRLRTITITNLTTTLTRDTGDEFNIDTAASGNSFALDLRIVTEVKVRNISDYNIVFQNDALDTTLYTIKPGEVVYIYKDSASVYEITSAGKIDGTYLKEVYGSSSFNGDGATTTFTVTHGAGYTPAQVFITPTSENAAAEHYISSKTSTTFAVTYTSPPPAGTGNIALDWTTVPS